MSSGLRSPVTGCRPVGRRSPRAPAGRLTEYRHGPPVPLGPGEIPSPVSRRPSPTALPANGLRAGSTSPQANPGDGLSALSAGPAAGPRARPNPHRRVAAERLPLDPSAPISWAPIRRSLPSRGPWATPSGRATSTSSSSGVNPADRSFVELSNHAVQRPGARRGPATALATRAVPTRSASGGVPPRRVPVSAPLSDRLAPSPAATMAREVPGSARSAPIRPIPGGNATSGRDASAPHRRATAADRCRHRAGVELGPEKAA